MEKHVKIKINIDNFIILNDDKVKQNSINKKNSSDKGKRNSVIIKNSASFKEDFNEKKSKSPDKRSTLKQSEYFKLNLQEVKEESKQDRCNNLSSDYTNKEMNTININHNDQNMDINNIRNMHTPNRNIDYSNFILMIKYKKIKRSKELNTNSNFIFEFTDLRMKTIVFEIYLILNGSTVKSGKLTVDIENKDKTLINEVILNNCIFSPRKNNSFKNIKIESSNISITFKISINYIDSNTTSCKEENQFNRSNKRISNYVPILEINKSERKIDEDDNSSKWSVKNSIDGVDLCNQNINLTETRLDISYISLDMDNVANVQFNNNFIALTKEFDEYIDYFREDKKILAEVNSKINDSISISNKEITKTKDKNNDSLRGSAIAKRKPSKKNTIKFSVIKEEDETKNIDKSSNLRSSSTFISKKSIKDFNNIVTKNSHLFPEIINYTIKNNSHKLDEKMCNYLTIAYYFIVYKRFFKEGYDYMLSLINKSKKFCELSNKFMCKLNCAEEIRLKLRFQKKMLLNRKNVKRLVKDNLEVQEENLNLLKKLSKIDYNKSEVNKCSNYFSYEKEVVIKALKNVLIKKNNIQNLPTEKKEFIAEFIEKQNIVLFYNNNENVEEKEEKNFNKPNLSSLEKINISLKEIMKKRQDISKIISKQRMSFLEPKKPVIKEQNENENNNKNTYLTSANNISFNNIDSILEKELKSFYSNSYHKNPQFIKKGTNDYYIDKNKVLVKFDNKSNILQSKFLII